MKHLVPLAAVLVAAAGAARVPAQPPASPAPSQDRPAHAQEPGLEGGDARFDPAVPAALEVKRTPTGHLLVRPVVNGHEAGWFIFDTGAGICVVSTPHVEALGLTAAGEIQAVGVGGAGSKSLYTAGTLTLGPITLTDHTVMATDLSFLKQFLGEEIAGVIGYGVLSRCVAEIDIGTPRISLHEPAAHTLDAGEWTELVLTDRIPAVRARFEDRDGLFRLDTGANRAVTFHQPAVEKWKLLEGRDCRDAKLGGVGGFVASKEGTVAWFELGGVRHENVRAAFAVEAKGAFAESSKDGNIGADLLRPFILVVDYPHERIAFVKREPDAPKQPDAAR